MIKTEILVVVASVKAAKDEQSKNYVDFLLIGGVISLAIDNTQFETLKKLEGQQINACFELKPSQIVRFGRSVTILEPHKFLNSKIDFKNEE